MTRPVVALVQARMGSARFPGKMMAGLEGYPVLRWVLERVGRAASIDAIVLATSENAADDVLCDLARGMGIATFRGSEDDVLGRFAGAASEARAGTVVRVCADNPLIAPEALDALVSGFVRARPDYAFNHMPRLDSLYPDGLGAEALSAELLYALDDRAEQPAHREHVTSYIWDNRDQYRILAADCPPGLEARGAAIRLDVDRPGDLRALGALCAGMDFDTPAADIVARWRETAGSPAA